jgi:hypothetical protein
VPHYMYRSCLQSAIAMGKERMKGQPVASFEHEMDLWFFMGVLRQRWKDHKRGKAF